MLEKLGGKVELLSSLRPGGNGLEARIKKLGVVATGDAIVLTVGEPMGQAGGTNTLKIVNVK